MTLPHDFLMPPGVGGALIIGATKQPEESPDAILRRREVEKLDFPAWVADPKAESTVAPILSYFARVLVTEELGTDIEHLSKLRALVDRLEGSRAPDRRKGSLKELRRLIVLSDYLLRRYLPTAMTCVGGAPAARMLRDLPQLKVAVDVYEGSKILDRLARVMSESVNPEKVSDEEFLLVNALSFSGLFFKGFTDLLRLMQESIGGTTAASPGGAGFTVSTTAAAAPTQAPAPQGEVMDVDGSLIRDMVNYVFSVYGAARTLAFRSLAGRGAMLEVDQMGLACLAEMLAV